MKVDAIKTKAIRIGSKTLFSLQKHSPEILMVVGIAGIIGGVVISCKATLKAPDILDKAREQSSEAHTALEICPEDYNEKDLRSDLTCIYTEATVSFVKLYLPAAVLLTTGLVCAVLSNDILKKRGAALAAAFSVSESAFKQYRKNVVERFGEDVDRELRYSAVETTVEEEVTNDKGKTKLVNKTVMTPSRDGYSQYARFFEASNPNWENSGTMNRDWLLLQQSYLNNKLIVKGFLFLNDVYDALGIPRSKEGQIVGWVYNDKPEDGCGDNFIDFGISDMDNERKREFLLGTEATVLLDFNVDGNIWELM